MVDQGLSTILTTTVDMRSNVGLDTDLDEKKEVGKASDQVGQCTTDQNNIEAANVHIEMKTRKVLLGGSHGGSRYSGCTFQNAQRKFHEYA